jgi:release factor glutamine methyltransferase
MTLSNLDAPTQMTVREALQPPQQWGVATVDARLLLQHVTGKSHAALLTRPEESLDRAQQEKLQNLLVRRRQGEPVAYLIGEREFYSLNFKVNSDVLIPRPETELLVDTALKHIPLTAPYKILDLGSGSGAVAVAIAHHRPQAQITAVDISEAALQLAQKNAERHNTRNIRFMHSDWFAAVGIEKFDLIVANPPYIAADDEHLQQGDLRFEPQIALQSGWDGLDAIRRIVANASAHLVSAGSLWFEHGYNQAESCQYLLRLSGFEAVMSLADLAGTLRVSGGWSKMRPKQK